MNDDYNLRKHPELFYLTDNSFHVCPKCFERWACETIQNYGKHDHSEFIEPCYNCSKSTYASQKNLGKLPEFIVKQLIASHEELKEYAEQVRYEESVC